VQVTSIPCLRTARYTDLSQGMLNR
jgi:hypothetical protein